MEKEHIFHDLNDDCPSLPVCPFAELKCSTTAECWKFMYCLSDSMRGFEMCARYKHSNLQGTPAPKNLLPDGSILES